MPGWVGAAVQVHGQLRNAQVREGLETVAGCFGLRGSEG